MSSGTGSRRGIAADDVVDWVKTYYAHITLAVLMLFMFWVRVRPMNTFRGTDPMHWQAVDSYYHWRTTEWTVQNFPFTMPYEVFTGFPTGTYVGQFGTLFDQFIALMALLFGLGSPGATEIQLAGLIGVPLLATLVAIPVYLIGRRLAGRVGALAGVAILALVPGEFLTRSVAGMFQHHAAEVLMMAISMLAMMVALRVAEREQPVWELVIDRDWTALKRPTIYSVAAGISLVIYALVWPPSIILVGIFGVFFVVAITIEHLRGRSPEPLAFVGVVALGTMALVSLPFIEVWGFDGITAFDLFVPVAALAVVIGSLVLGGLSRAWFRRDLEPTSYPVAVGAIGLVGVIAMWLALPDVFSFFWGNLTGRVLPLDPSEGALTVAEARPPDALGEFFFEQFGFAFYTMIIGLIAIAARPFFGQRYRVEHLLIIVWSLFLISMAMTQIRFSYYLVLAVAVVNAYLVTLVFNFVELPSMDTIGSIKGYQVLTVILVLVVLFVPMLNPIAATSAFDVSERAGPSADGVFWQESTQFLNENTPQPGDWGEHENSDQLDLWGTYDRPNNGHDYPAGAYGVMSWWDYGHLITTHGERIPHANPFQQNARSAAHYLLSTSEEQANMHLDAIEATGDGVSTNDMDELQAILDEHDGELDTDMRYVMIDDQMAALNPGKMQAIAQWTDVGVGDLSETGEFTDVLTGQNVTAPGVSELYEDTMINRLYFDDTIGLDHYRLVHETQRSTPFGTVHLDAEDVTLVNTRLNVPVDALGGLTPAQFAQMQGEALYDMREEASVKTFERVEGATITGTADDPSSTIVAEVDIETNAGNNITYRNTAEVADDGTFEITVPYATDHDRSVEDGYTDSAIETADHYMISEVSDLDEDALAEADEAAESIEDHDVGNITQQGTVAVSETDVYEGNELGVELVQPASVEIQSFEMPGTVELNETFEIEAQLTNTGELPTTQTVTLSDVNRTIAEETITLEANESITLTFEHAITNASHDQLTLTTDDDLRIAVVDVENDNDTDTESIPIRPFW